MGIAAKKRVYWFYLILGIIFFFFYLFVLYGTPHIPDTAYSDFIMHKLLNVPKSIKLSLVYCGIVVISSALGWLVSNIIGHPNYKKSFLISFLCGSLLSIIIFILIFYFNSFVRNVG